MRKLVDPRVAGSHRGGGTRGRSCGSGTGCTGVHAGVKVEVQVAVDIQLMLDHRVDVALQASLQRLEVQVTGERVVEGQQVPHDLRRRGTDDAGL